MAPRCPSLLSLRGRCVHGPSVACGSSVVDGLQHVRLSVDSVRALPGPTLLAEGPLAAADADTAPHTSRPAAEINGAGDPPPTVSSTRRGPRSYRAHRPGSKTTYLLQCRSDASGPRVPSSTAPPSLWLCISSISC